MPELPEIETVKLQLQLVLPGKMISGIEVLKERTVIGDWKLAIGKEVVCVKRRGKVLIIDLTENVSMAFHFKMTGQLIYQDDARRLTGGHPTKDFIGELPSKHTRIIISADDAKLYFNDQRLFGWMRVGSTEDINQMVFFQKLGLEIWEMDEEEFKKRLMKIKRSVKLAIMDQEVLSGVGNIYANDACWVAKIDPMRPASTLKGLQYKELYFAIRMVLEEGIKYGGATAADAKYIDLHGLGGHYQEHFKTYDREGQPCLRNDNGLIKKVKMGGRGTYFCPICQK